MKRLLVLLVTAVIILSLLALPISAEEAEENKGFFEKAEDFFSNMETAFGFPIQIFNWNIISVDGEAITLTLRNGGFNYVSSNSIINDIISTIYKILYPIGFIVMLLCWGFGIAKSTISTSLDFKDKNSIVNSIISLIIGLAATALLLTITSYITYQTTICTYILQST